MIIKNVIGKVMSDFQIDTWKYLQYLQSKSHSHHEIAQLNQESLSIINKYCHISQDYSEIDM